MSAHNNWLFTLLRLKGFSSEKRSREFQYFTIMFFGNCSQNSNALYDDYR